MWKAGLMLVLVLGLAACVPAPFQSPVTFRSPLPKPSVRGVVYLPLVVKDAELRAPLPSVKKGVSVACGYDDMARLTYELRRLNVSWIWNWEPNPPIFPGIESVPTIWGPTDIGLPLGGNSEWGMGFNEPEQCPDQSCLTPAQACALWPELEAKTVGLKLTSPQVVQWPATWLEDFYTTCIELNGKPPKMDAIVIHTYLGGSASYREQVTYYMALAQRWGVPEVWVTEFTLSPGLDRTVRETLNDLSDYIAWLDAQEMVTHYALWTNRLDCTAEFAPGSFFDTPLFAGNGNLTEAGRMYISAGGR